MLTTLVLQSLLAGVAVDAVSADQQADAINVDLQTSEPVSDGLVRGLVGPRRLYLFVTGASSGDVALGPGAEKVRIHQRPQYLKLELPLAPGTQCDEPARVAGTPTGVHVRFSCRSKETPTAAATPEPRTAPATDKKSAELLRAALALPDERAFAPEPAAKPSPEQATKAHDEPRAAAQERSRQPTPAPAAEPEAPGNASETEAAMAASAPGAQAAPSPAPPADLTPAPAPESGASVGARKPVGPAAASWLAPALVFALVAAGMLVWSRRRARRQGLIQIVESASIGPKRSLLVAKIGGRTLVLGASEAGITLLETLSGEATAPVATDSATREPGLAQTATPPDPPANGGEEGLLRRLFGRRDAAREAREAADFRALLDEPVADEELRRKLERGLGARVS